MYMSDITVTYSTECIDEPPWYFNNKDIEFVVEISIK